MKGRQCLLFSRILEVRLLTALEAAVLLTDMLEGGSYEAQELGQTF